MEVTESLNRSSLLHRRNPYMHPFRLCDSAMLHKSNLQSYRRPSFKRFLTQLSHAFCFSYSICTRSVSRCLVFSRMKERRWEESSNYWEYWQHNSAHNAQYLLGTQTFGNVICVRDLKEKSNMSCFTVHKAELVCFILVVCFSLFCEKWKTSFRVREKGFLFRAAILHHVQHPHEIEIHCIKERNSGWKNNPDW